jgi:deoxyribodipyrimidine photo-lyase
VAGRPPIVVWFRRDLRLDDHPALAAAVEDGGPIIPLVVIDPRLERSPSMSPHRWRRFESAVAGLDRDLRSIGGRLIVRHGDPRHVVPALVAETEARRVVASRDVSPYAVRRDLVVASAVQLELLPGILAVEPEQVGDARVFAAFHRRWEAVPLGSPHPAPARVTVPEEVTGHAVPDAPPRGTAEALARLDAFVRGRASEYEANRDRLDLEATSGLSADLHLGTISPRRVIAGVDVAAFRRQLAWRDWAHHLLWFHPEIATGRAADDAADLARREPAWRDDLPGLTAWKDGRTGHPVVDAAMRQLAATGTMHNRARMIVASFLTKDLLVDWRLGAAHFLRELEDGDVANNTLGWRWTSGIGHDAAPFFRVFNPVLQARRFDPYGVWVRRWIPELASVPGAWVHEPWAAPGGPPPGYPPRIVDHGAARARALAAFNGRRPTGR